MYILVKHQPQFLSSEWSAGRKKINRLDASKLTSEREKE
jgi:hypothetical protein